MPAEPARGPCPSCGELISIHPVRCRFCGADLAEENDRPMGRPREQEYDEPVKWLIPVGRSGWAIAAGYLGLLALFPMVGFGFGILAVICGIMALRHIKQNPKLSGMGRAILGLVLGPIGIVVYGLAILAVFFL